MAANLHVAFLFLKERPKIKNEAGFFVFDKFSLLVSLGDESGGV